MVSEAAVPGALHTRAGLPLPVHALHHVVVVVALVGCVSSLCAANHRAVPLTIAQPLPASTTPTRADFAPPRPIRARLTRAQV